MGDHHHRVRTRCYTRLEQPSDILLVARPIPFSESAPQSRFRRYVRRLHGSPIARRKKPGLNPVVDSEGGILKARLTFPPEYPLLPPEMKFLTPMWHPNGQCTRHPHHYLGY